MNKLEQKSKLLSFLLRHKPEAKQLTLDKEGWCSIVQLCVNAGFTTAELSQIEAEDEKNRYSIREINGVSCIRANQGHSTSAVNLVFKKAVPPTVLYHGADASVISQILKQGLLPMARHHVHLSDNLETAKAVGARRKGFVLLKIDAKQMLVDNVPFFISDNGVWLVDTVQPKYITQL